MGSEREYAGNKGYADELEAVYRYDSLVPNSRQIAEGDLLIIRNGKAVLGTARASRIVVREGSKDLRRCTECGTATIKERKNKLPRYRCKAKHVFDQPRLEPKECKLFDVYFKGTFRPIPELLPVGQVRQACPRYNGQLAMQELALDRLQGRARNLLFGVASSSLERGGVVLFAADASDEPYVPDGSDERQVIERQLRARRGQRRFRENLLARFDGRCLVTGCKLPDLLEAAHVSPYRGDKENHPSNGLLLRADIHTLFDLELLGIEPVTLRLHVNPRLEGTEYEQFANRKLECGSALPSNKALESRWKMFQERLQK